MSHVKKSRTIRSILLGVGSVVDLCPDTGSEMDRLYREATQPTGSAIKTCWLKVGDFMCQGRKSAVREADVVKAERIAEILQKQVAEMLRLEAQRPQRMEFTDEQRQQLQQLIAAARDKREKLTPKL